MYKSMIGAPEDSLFDLFSFSDEELERKYKSKKNEEEEKMDCTIMIVKITERAQISPKVQEILSKFGCIISMRLGLHDAGDRCSSNGFLVLQLCGEKEEMAKLEAELNAIDEVKAKTVVFDDFE